MVELVKDAETGQDIEPGRPIGHYAHDGEGSRMALCGAPILGIEAFGDFTVCPRCAALREAEYLAWLEAGAPF